MLKNPNKYHINHQEISYKHMENIKINKKYLKTYEKINYLKH